MCGPVSAGWPHTDDATFAPCASWHVAPRTVRQVQVFTFLDATTQGASVCSRARAAAGGRSATQRARSCTLVAASPLGAQHTLRQPPPCAGVGGLVLQTTAQLTQPAGAAGHAAASGCWLAIGRLGLAKEALLLMQLTRWRMKQTHAQHGTKRFRTVLQPTAGPARGQAANSHAAGWPPAPHAQALVRRRCRSAFVTPSQRAPRPAPRPAQWSGGTKGLHSLAAMPP